MNPIVKELMERFGLSEPEATEVAESIIRPRLRPVEELGEDIDIIPRLRPGPVQGPPQPPASVPQMQGPAVNPAGIPAPAGVPTGDGPFAPRRGTPPFIPNPSAPLQPGMTPFEQPLVPYPLQDEDLEPRPFVSPEQPVPPDLGAPGPEPLVDETGDGLIGPMQPVPDLQYGPPRRGANSPLPPPSDGGPVEEPGFFEGMGDILFGPVGNPGDGDIVLDADADEDILAPEQFGPPMPEDFDLSGDDPVIPAEQFGLPVDDPTGTMLREDALRAVSPSPGGGQTYQTPGVEQNFLLRGDLSQLGGAVPQAVQESRSRMQEAADRIRSRAQGRGNWWANSPLNPRYNPAGYIEAGLAMLGGPGGTSFAQDLGLGAGTLWRHKQGEIDQAEAARLAEEARLRKIAVEDRDYQLRRDRFEWEKSKAADDRNARLELERLKRQAAGAELTPGEEAELREGGKATVQLQKAQYEQAVAASKNSSAAIQAAQAIVDGTVITGNAVQLRTDWANLRRGIGGYFGGNVDNLSDKISASKLLDQVLNQATLDRASDLTGPKSDKDVVFLKESTGLDRSSSPEVLRRAMALHLDIIYDDAVKANAIAAERGWPQVMSPEDLQEIHAATEILREGIDYGLDDDDDAGSDDALDFTTEPPSFEGTGEDEDYSFGGTE